jgi:outer membrane protein TolC
MVKVLENAYSVLLAQEMLQSALISYEDAENLLNVAKELNRAGVSPISDVYTSQATLSQMKMELAMQTALLDIQKGKLANSLGIPATTSLELAPLDAIQTQQLQQTEDLIALAWEQRADLIAKQARLTESLYNQDKIAASYGPKVFLGGRGGPNYAFHDKEHGAQYQISLNFEMPLFNGFETTYQNRIAYADTQLAMQDLADLQLDIYLEVLTYNRTLEAAQEMLPDAEENLKNSLKAYESVLQRYQAGIERIAEVSNAQRQLATARVRCSDVKTRWLISMANLAYATGTLGPYLEIPCKK